jgi:hypothetical protein
LTNKQNIDILNQFLASQQTFAEKKRVTMFVANLIDKKNEIFNNFPKGINKLLVRHFLLAA